MRRRKSLTLIEILIVLSILGILSVLSIFSYQYFIDKSKSAEAIINAGTIRKAEEIHKIETGSYAAASDIKQINDLLALDILPKYYEYQVVGVTEDNFIIIAKRIGQDIELGKNVLAMNKSELMSSGYEPYVTSGVKGSGSSSSGTSGDAGGSGLGTGSAGGGGSGGAGGGGSEGSGGTGGGGSGGGSGGAGDIAMGGGSLAAVELSNVLALLQGSTTGTYYYDLIQDKNITIAYSSELGSGVLGQWIPTYWLDFYPSESVVPNTIYINSLLSTAWEAEAIGAVLVHEALHADYNYYTDKWVAATTERYGIDSSELSWVIDPVTNGYILTDSLDQEYNAFVQAAIFWQETRGSKVNVEMDTVLALYEQGGSELMDAVTSAYAGYPPYAKELQ